MTSARERRIADEAARWVVTFDGGVAFTPKDVRAFRRWIARGEDHRAAFETASRAWDRLDLLGKLENFPLPEEDPPRFDRRALIAGAAAGAVGVAAFGLGAYGFLGERAEAYETGVGELRAVTLADGTRAFLDADTRIEARIDAKHREVRLVRGEVLFAVAVAVAGTETQGGGETEGGKAVGGGAVGGAAEHASGGPRSVFRVLTPSGALDLEQGLVLAKILPQGARLSLLSGVAHARRAQGLGLGLGSGSAPPVAVAPGSELLLGPGFEIRRIDAPLRERRLLWREGRLSFENAPLSEACADVSRHTGARFVFADPALAPRRIGGVIDAQDLNGFLHMLQDNLGLAARRRGDGGIELSEPAGVPR